ncbi:MAG: GntR family transcriptional regulator [Agrobacterium sp.]|uniref:GntR family transcriptional regulator n=1 Tax=Agrobacterium sp. TaxID=361 RepID=UPI0009E3AF44|nr:FCD domain-containing protein [Agrobacterium tumefaciens]
MPKIRCPTDFDRSVCRSGYVGPHKFPIRSPLAYDFALLLFPPQLRVAFEGMAIRLAARNVPEKIAREMLEKYRAAGAITGAERIARLREVDDAIHDIAFEYCNNKRLRKMMESVRDLVYCSKQTIIRNVPEPYEATLPEHLAICEALVNRDGDAAERAMRSHLENSLARIMEWLNAHPHESSAPSTTG